VAEKQRSRDAGPRAYWPKTPQNSVICRLLGGRARILPRVGHTACSSLLLQGFYAPLEFPPLRRLLITVLAVAGLCWCINSLENVQGERSPAPDWVRTVDGWERESVVTYQPPASTFFAFEMHPALVASFQLGMSLFFLLAFPPNVGRSVKAVAASRLDVGSSLLVGA